MGLLPGRSEAWLGHRHRWLGRMDGHGRFRGRPREAKLVDVDAHGLFILIFGAHRGICLHACLFSRMLPPEG